MDPCALHFPQQHLTNHLGKINNPEFNPEQRPLGQLLGMKDYEVLN